MTHEREPSYQDWMNAIPAERRNLFAKHLEIGRARMQDSWDDGSNVHGQPSCPCLICTEKIRGAA